MKFYFGQVPDSDVEMFGSDELFEADGAYWYYCVEFGSNPGGLEDCVLTDTVGRSVPLSVEAIEGLQEVLQGIADRLATIKAGEDALEEVMDPYATVTDYAPGFFSPFSN